MNRYGHRTISLFSILRQHARLLRLAALTAGLAVLAGCANTSNPSSPSLTELDSYRTPWTTESDDPIGAILAQRLRQQRSLAVYQNGHHVSGASVGVNPSDDNTLLAGEALNYLGIRYRYGGSSPSTGFDCSGLVTYAAEHSMGMKLPRNAAEIQEVGTPIARSDLQVGDLVFFNTMGRRYSHVGIYLGDDRFVHSPSAGGVVRIERLDMAYWVKRYNGARRLDTTLIASAHAQN
jgi:cell wall-associated NlpC family hydrolase